MERAVAEDAVTTERCMQRDRHMRARRQIRRLRSALDIGRAWPFSRPFSRPFCQADGVGRPGLGPYGPAPEFCSWDFDWDEQWTEADEAWYQLDSGQLAGDSPPSTEDEDAGSDSMESAASLD